MATPQQLAALSAGGFTRIDRRVDNGDGTFTFVLIGGAMEPKYKNGHRYTYDSSVAFSSLTKGDVVVLELTVGTYQVTRIHGFDRGDLIVKYDASLYPDSMFVRPSWYLGRLTT